VSADVHPTDSAGPLAVSAGTAGPPVAFTERAGIDPATGRLVMFLRIAQIDGDPADATTRAPGVRLAAGPGAATDIGPAPTAVAADPVAGPVAMATRVEEPDALTLVEVEVLHPGSPWRLQIVNRDGRDHRYVWVVADSDEGTRRPWFDLPTPELAFRTAVGEAAAPRDLPVANHGPGPLTLDDPDGTVLGAGFTLLSVTPRPIGANGRGSARIAFTTPAAPAQLAIGHTFTSDDPGAGTAAGHRNRVALTVEVYLAARWVPGDILLLGELTLDRLDRATGRPVPVGAVAAGAVDVAVDPTTGDALLLGTNFVKRVDRLTGAETALPGFTTLATPVAIAVERNGTVVVLDAGSSSLIRIAPDGTRTDTVAGVLANARDMTVGPDDTAVVTGVEPGEVSSRGKVWRIDRSGSTTVVGTDHDAGSFRVRTRSIATESDGTILIGYQSQSFPGPFNAASLLRIDPDSGQAQFFIVDSRELTNPVSLAVTRDGTVLVSGSLGLFAVHPETGVPTPLTDVFVNRIAVVPPVAP
jgi:hypothetical protein